MSGPGRGGGTRGSGSGPLLRLDPATRDSVSLAAAILQGIALGALAFELPWLVAATFATPSLTYILLAVALAGLLVTGVIGFRRWLRGGPATTLYAVDAAPLLFVAIYVNPGVFQTPLGIIIGALFVLPMLALYVAGRR